MSVQSDKARDESLGSYTVTNVTPPGFSQHESSPSTYVECQSVSKTSYSRPGEIDSTSGTLINPNGV